MMAFASLNVAVEDGDVGDVSQHTDEAQGKGQHDDEGCDLGEGSVLEEILAPWSLWRSATGATS